MFLYLLQTTIRFGLSIADCFLGCLFWPFTLCQQLHFSLCRQHSSGNRGNSQENLKTVVIIGANFAGLKALREVSYHPKLRVIVVDQREYFEYVPGVLRLFCDPALFWHIAKLIPSGSHEFVLGTATAISENHVLVARSGGSTTRLDFDYLVVATGADFRKPITPTVSESTLSSRCESWTREAHRVRSANSILILGGGAVGTELAAEIVCHYPRKRVTIVDAASTLVPLFPPKTSQYVKEWFAQRGVDLLLGQNLHKWDENSCTTKEGKVIRADIVYVCFGMRCNSQLLSVSTLSQSLGPRQEVRVNEYMQLLGYEHIFSAGDVMSHPSNEIKQAYYAEFNGIAAGKNVVRHFEKKPLLKYPDDVAHTTTMPFVYVVSLGRYGGSLGFNKIVINGCIPAMVKWFIEWSKVKEMQGRPIGWLIWALGDAVTILLSRTCLKPGVKGRD